MTHEGITLEPCPWASDRVHLTWEPVATERQGPGQPIYHYARPAITPALPSCWSREHLQALHVATGLFLCGGPVTPDDCPCFDSGREVRRD